MNEFRNHQNYENLQRRIYEGVGKYGMPPILPEVYEGDCEWVAFDLRNKFKNELESKGCHFFRDDYKFNQIWFNPDRYIPILKRFRYVMTPDFSSYTDFPEAIQIYNSYRKHWVGAYMQEHGIKVIPTISWSLPDSYEWCFDGEPEGATVAVSSCGCMKNKQAKELFIQGYKEMIDRLHPETILFFGEVVPKECEGNIVRLNTYYSKFHEGLCEE